MAGGDDLESDDEYVDTKWMVKGPSDDISATSSHDDDADTGTGKKSGKRKNPAAVHVHDDTIDQEPKSSKRIKVKSKNQLLLETGRQIANEPTDIQAAFMWTCFTHYLQLSGDTLSSYRKFVASDFVQSPQTSLVEKIKSHVSVKRMKKWKVMKCPLVLIVCSSARRAVALLKDIEALQLRVAKLFAKHMDLEEQIQLLEDKAHSIAVGTPNRLLKLCETNCQEKKEVASLNFHQTQLVILDSWEDSKRFTVCTLHDTAPDLMKLMQSAIIPELQQRPNLKLAFF